MICFFLLTIAYSCEQADVKKSSTNPDGVITLREDCEDCSVGCCCCAIEAVTPADINLRLCGTCDDGDMPCGPYSPPSPCSTFSGAVKPLAFDANHPRRLFCVPEGGSFRIQNTSSTQTVSFRFTCRPDVTPLTYVNVTLGPTDAQFFHNDGSCIAAGCN